MQFSTIAAAALVAVSPVMGKTLTFQNSCKTGVIVASEADHQPRLIKAGEKFVAGTRPRISEFVQFRATPEHNPPPYEGVWAPYLLVHHAFINNTFSFGASTVFGNPFRGTYTQLHTEYTEPEGRIRRNTTTIGSEGLKDEGVCSDGFIVADYETTAHVEFCARR